MVVFIVKSHDCDLLRIISVKIKIANKININICIEMRGNVLNLCKKNVTM